jgi:hypothetical protein
MTRPLLSPDSPPPLPESASVSAPAASPVGAESPSSGRAESPLATQLPAWDLLPPSAFVRRNTRK